jgi:hypothetical protein
VKIISKLEPSTRLKVVPVLFAQKSVHAAQKIVHIKTFENQNAYDIKKLVFGMPLAVLKKGLGTRK